MGLHRVIAYILSCLTLGLSVFVYAKYIYLLGFPDGFISELAQAQRQLAYLFIGISLTIGIWLIYLGNVAKKTKIHTILFITIFLYLLAIAGIFALNHHYQLHLPSSFGG